MRLLDSACPFWLFRPPSYIYEIDVMDEAAAVAFTVRTAPGKTNEVRALRLIVAAEMPSSCCLTVDMLQHIT